MEGVSFVSMRAAVYRVVSLHSGASRLLARLVSHRQSDYIARFIIEDEEVRPRGAKRHVRRASRDMLYL